MDKKKEIPLSVEDLEEEIQKKNSELLDCCKKMEKIVILLFSLLKNYLWLKYFSWHVYILDIL